jgi:hypothetical protein
MSGRYSWPVFDPPLEDANGSRGVDAVSHVGVTDDVASARLVVDGLAGGLVDSLRPVDGVDMGLAIRVYKAGPSDVPMPPMTPCAVCR